MGSLHLPSMWHEWTLAEVCLEASRSQGWTRLAVDRQSRDAGNRQNGQMALPDAVAASTQGSCGGEGLGDSPLSAK